MNSHDLKRCIHFFCVEKTLEEAKIIHFLKKKAIHIHIYVD